MRSDRNGLLAAVAVALLGVGAASSPAAAGGFEQVSQKLAGPAHGDGGSWVAYATDAATLQVIEEASDDTHRVPIPCATEQATDPLLAVGGGQAVVGCARDEGPAPRPLLLDLVSGAWREIPGIEGLLPQYEGQSSTDGLRVDAIGTRWIAAIGSTYHSAQHVTIDWRTGALGPQPTVAAAADLSARGLDVSLCAPLVRRPAEESADSDQRFEQLQYDAPLAASSGSALTLQRCGSTVTTTLEPASHDTPAAEAVQLSGGVVSWRARYARLYLPGCRLRLSWADAPGWLHTARSLYRSTLTSSADGWTIERAPLPTCARAARPAGARVGSGGRSVAALTVSGTWPSAAGSRAELLGAPAGRPARLTVAPGATVAVSPVTAARSVRWRLGDGAWHAARRAAGRWRFTAPRTLRGTRTLTLDVVRDGGGVRQRVTLRAARQPGGRSPAR